MPYGMLDEFAQEGSIDFGKIGTGEINLTNWKYYNTENISTLTLGLDAYTEPNKGIAEVVLEFYDHQGLAAALHFNNRSSYSGIITENIPLNGVTQNYKLNNIDSNNSIFYHAGLELSQFEEGCLVKTADGKFELATEEQENATYYTNDAGTLYSNFLYGVKIVIKYCSIDSFGEYIIDGKQYKTFYRWYWTNNMYNEYYYNTSDFDSLPLNLTLDIAIDYSTDNYKNEQKQFTQEGDVAATVQQICTDINIKANAGLLETYNTFSLSVNILESLKTDIILGNKYILNSNDKPAVKQLTNDNVQINEDIYPINNIENNYTYPEPLATLLGTKVDNKKGKEWQNYPNIFDNVGEGFNESTTNLVYINYKGEAISTSNYQIKNSIRFEDIFNTKTKLLETNIIHLSKYQNYFKEDNSEEDLGKYNHGLQENGLGIINTIADITIIRYDSGLDKEFHYETRSGKTGQYIYEGFMDTEGDVNFSLFNSTTDRYWLTSTPVGDDNLVVQPYGSGESPTDLSELFPEGFTLLKINPIRNERDNVFTKMDGTALQKNNKYTGGEAPFKDNFSYKHNEDWFTLLYKSDIKDQIRILNDYSVTKGTANGITNNISTKNYSIGSALLGLLTNVYTLSEETLTTSINILHDRLFLDNHKTQFIQDIVYKIYKKEQSNSDILVKGFQLDNLIANIQSNLDGSLKEIKLQLMDSLKNIPLSFNVQYVQPDLDIYSNMFTLLSVYNDAPYIIKQSVSKGVFYYLENGELKRIVGETDIQFPNYWKIENGLLKCSNKNLQHITISNISKLFTLEDTLKLKRYEISYLSNMYQVKSEGNGGLFLKHFLIDENIFPDFKYFK